MTIYSKKIKQILSTTSVGCALVLFAACDGGDIGSSPSGPLGSGGGGGKLSGPVTIVQNVLSLPDQFTNSDVITFTVSSDNGERIIMNGPASALFQGTAITGSRLPGRDNVGFVYTPGSDARIVFSVAESSDRDIINRLNGDLSRAGSGLRTALIDYRNTNSGAAYQNLRREVALVVPGQEMSIEFAGSGDLFISRTYLFTIDQRTAATNVQETGSKVTIVGERFVLDASTELRNTWNGRLTHARRNAAP